VRGGGRKEEAVVTREEPSACRLPASVGDSPEIASIRSHYVLLVASAAITRALERQPVSVMAEVGFGILAAERYLIDCLEMTLAGQGRDGSRFCS
jgi:hypothetical protein